MRRKCMKSGAWIAGLGVLIALAVAAWADAVPPVEGDLQAWAEIVAAFKKLTGLSGYRIKFVSSTGPTGVIEAVPRSNTSYTVLTNKEGAQEWLNSDHQTAFRFNRTGATSSWQCFGGDPNPFLIFDPDDREYELTVIRKPDSVIDGIPVHAYELRSPDESGALYIGSQTGLPRQMVSTRMESLKEITETVSYYDYGAKITVPPWPCK